MPAPVLMAFGMNPIGLIPVMTASGIGAGVAKRIASPMFSGLVSLTVLTLLVIPVVYMLRERRLALRSSNKAADPRAA